MVNVDLQMKLPAQLCNIARLLSVLEEQDLDGIVLGGTANVFYMSTFSSAAVQSAPEGLSIKFVVFSRREPDHPILIVPEFDLHYFMGTPTWVEDVRAWPSGWFPPGLFTNDDTFDRLVPLSVRGTPWGAAARSRYGGERDAVLAAAMADLGLSSGRIGFDDLRVAAGLKNLFSIETVDLWGTMHRVRQVKTPVELDLLRVAARVNELALERTVAAWDRGTSWQEIVRRYHQEVVSLGGFIRDPGGVVVGNAPQREPVFHMGGRDDDFTVNSGDAMAFDCHGTINHYCWDGGKTWLVDGIERSGDARQIELAAQESLRAIEYATVPGVTFAELELVGRDVFRKMNVPDPDRSLVFFHGLGLDHVDLAVGTEGFRGVRLEENMVVSIHVAYPGAPEERYYLEDNAIVTPHGGESIYSWGVEPLH